MDIAGNERACKPSVEEIDRVVKYLHGLGFVFSIPTHTGYHGVAAQDVAGISGDLLLHEANLLSVTKEELLEFKHADYWTPICQHPGCENSSGNHTPLQWLRQGRRHLCSKHGGR